MKREISLKKKVSLVIREIAKAFEKSNDWKEFDNMCYQIATEYNVKYELVFKLYRRCLR